MVDFHIVVLLEQAFVLPRREFVILRVSVHGDYKSPVSEDLWEQGSPESDDLWGYPGSVV